MSNLNSTTNNKNASGKKDNNLLYIIIFSLLIIAAIIIAVILRPGTENSSNGSANNGVTQAATAGSISIVSESGAQDATVNSKIPNARKVKFSKSHKDIENYEKKQKDTLDGNYSEASDGYSYLTYQFDPQNAPTFFGTNVAAADINALLQYVFYNDSLSEIRLQYGSIGENAYNSIISNISGQYGDSTYSRTYSNGNKESWWKTKTVTLTVYYQDSGVSLYYRKN